MQQITPIPALSLAGKALDLVTALKIVAKSMKTLPMLSVDAHNLHQASNLQPLSQPTQAKLKKNALSSLSSSTKMTVITLNLMD